MPGPDLYSKDMLSLIPIIESNHITPFMNVMIFK